MTPQAIEALTTILKNSSTSLDGPHGYTQRVYNVLYNKKLEDAFDKLDNGFAESTTNNKKEADNSEKDFLQVNRIGLSGEYGECVSFIKANTNLGATKNWEAKEKNRLNYNKAKKLKAGTAISTSNKDGSYDGGHAAIFLKAYRSYILVIDQNWGTDSKKLKNIPEGALSIHKILFNGKGDVSDAGAYAPIE